MGEQSIEQPFNLDNVLDQLCSSQNSLASVSRTSGAALTNGKSQNA